MKTKEQGMQKWLRDNGLTLALGALFAGSFIGQMIAGFYAENQERMQDGAAMLGFGAYLVSGAFLSAVFENWESEFLQMWAYVVLTAYLFQRGSPESRDPDGEETRPGEGRRPRTLFAKIYAHSLGIALFVLFVASFTLHWINSARDAVEKAMEKGLPEPTLLQHLGNAQLWFESFQNWQSEFLSTAVLVVLGIFLRERGSPESKAVGAPNANTGS
jgi:hypothetical protein